MMIASAASSSILAREYFVKAAFLYNFARLVEWPEGTFKTKTGPINLCIMGRDPFGKALETIQNKKARGRSLLIRRGVGLDEMNQCQILFISQSEKSNIGKILALIGQFPILTVSELPKFAENNGHVRFFLTVEDTLSLEVNLNALKQVNLQMSSRILTFAKIMR